MRVPITTRDARVAFLHKVTNYNRFLHSNIFQNAKQGTKQYEAADKRCGVLEDEVREAFGYYQEHIHKEIAQVFVKVAKFKAAEAVMRMDSHDMWLEKILNAIERAEREPGRFVAEIKIEEVSE